MRPRHFSLATTITQWKLKVQQCSIFDETTYTFSSAFWANSFPEHRGDSNCCEQHGQQQHLPLELAAVVLLLESCAPEFLVTRTSNTYTNVVQFQNLPWEEKQVAPEVKAVDHLEQVELA